MSRTNLALAILMALGAVLLPEPAPAASVSVSSLLPKTDTKENPVVQLEPELEKFFGNLGCQLPKKLRDILKDKKKNGFIPSDLRKQLGEDLSRKVEKVSTKSARVVLHSAYYLDGDTVVPFSVASSSTYLGLDIMRLVDATNIDNVAFMMDCSGYLNASIQAGGGVPEAEIKNAAESALKTQTSAVLVRGAVFSPISSALNPTPRLLSDVERTDILYALVAEVLRLKPDAPDDLKLGSWREVALLWTSNQGSSSLQGKASFSAGGGISAGIFSLRGDLGTGGSYARSIQFSTFDTYILDTAVLPAGQPTALKAIRSELATLVKNARREVDRTKDSYVVTTDLPDTVCSLTWEAVGVRDDDAFAPKVDREPDAKKCVLELMPSKEALAQSTPFRLRARTAVAGTEPFQLLITP